jgi:hypothetical protein
VQSSREEINAQAIGNAFYGLQGMSSESSEVRTVLSALAKKVSMCSEDLTVQEIGNALYGLQGMSSDSSEVREVLSALTIKIHTCKGNLDAQAVGNAFYGLQGMSNDNSEVRNVLSALTTKVHSCTENLTAQNIGNSFLGLQGMTSDCSEIYDVLSALSTKLYACKEKLNAQNVGNAFYGLQGLSWMKNSPDFMSVISFLRLQVKTIVDDFSKAVDQFSGDSSVPNTSTNELVPVPNTPTNELVPVPNTPTIDLVTLCQSLIYLLPEISANIDMKVCKDLEEMNLMLRDELAFRKTGKDIYYNDLGFQSLAEKRMYDVASKVVRTTGTITHANIHLFDLFESDIILILPSNNNSKDIIINIEVDGIYHKHEKKIIFCDRKDKHLKSKGVYVSRIDVSDMDKMNNIELEQWVLQVISNAKSIDLDISMSGGTSGYTYENIPDSLNISLVKNQSTMKDMIPFKPKRYISEEQKNINNARARERRLRLKLEKENRE